jgi:hypothetical protein
MYGTALPVATGPEAVAAAQMAMRLTHDRRRLKQIQSIEKKIEAKREMIPEYEAWISGTLVGADLDGQGSVDPIVPTIMVWKIDTADYEGALELAEYVLRYDVPLPSHYERQPATLIVEEIAEAALRDLGNGRRFPFGILEHADLLTEDADMPDEVRAKLYKAMGLEIARQAELPEQTDATAIRALQDQALVALRRAQQLNDRIGVKDRIKKIERVIAKADAAATEQAGTAG